VQHLVDFSKPLDVALFDKLAAGFFQGHQKIAQLLVNFQSHPQAWMRVDSILEKSSSQEAKVLALRILEDAVRTKWKPLPKEQKEGIRAFVVGLIIKLSSSPDTMKAQAQLLKKLDVVLVQVGALILLVCRSLRCSPFWTSCRHAATLCHRATVPG